MDKNKIYDIVFKGAVKVLILVATLIVLILIVRFLTN
ncbi:MAG: hypothetical protein Greene07147_872 [Parcubacteria group bacterium Greene0714_7]|nr:MAG: hypothetical protein Greene07147_872 [Parcubacteria group bacterium Greene0714_7]